MSHPTPIIQKTGEGHTPGPWRFDDFDRAGLIIGAGGEHVATLNAYYSDKARDIANGNLIAAAPDLLEALKAAYGAINDAFGQANAEQQGLDNLASKYDDKISAFRAKARAAIAKAQAR